MRAQSVFSLIGITSLAAASLILGQPTNCTSPVYQQYELLFGVFQQTCASDGAPEPIKKQTFDDLGWTFVLRVFLTLIIHMGIQLNARHLVNSEGISAWAIILRMTWTILAPELVFYEAMTTFARVVRARNLMVAIGYRKESAPGVETGNFLIQISNGQFYPMTSESKPLEKICHDRLNTIRSDHDVLHRGSFSNYFSALLTIVELFSIFPTGLAMIFDISATTRLEIYIAAIIMCLFFAQVFSRT